MAHMPRDFIDPLNLLIIRHADAGNPFSDPLEDLSRPLSAKGLTQAALLKNWIRKTLSGDVKVVSSPAVRTAQTAKACGLKAKTDDRLLPNANLSDVCELLRDQGPHLHRKGPLVLVGHQPLLGQLLAYLVAGVPQQCWDIRKGTLWWLRFEDGEQFWRILTVVDPRLSGK